MPSPRLANSGPKKRCAATTREAILCAASCWFASRGYEQSGVREIAAEAGVTAALVNRYFRSKEGLFAEVVARSCDSDAILSRGRAGLADRLARNVVLGEEIGSGERGTPLLLLLRAATEPRAADLLRANLERTFIAPLARLLSGPDAELRAGLVAAQMIGFATLDQMIRTDAFAAADREDLVRRLARVFDFCMN